MVVGCRWHKREEGAENGREKGREGGGREREREKRGGEQEQNNITIAIWQRMGHLRAWRVGLLLAV